MKPLLGSLMEKENPRENKIHNGGHGGIVAVGAYYPSRFQTRDLRLTSASQTNVRSDAI